jgi:xylitol oxidase
MSAKITNWSGNLTYGTTAIREAYTPEDVCSLVRESPRLKVLGTRHCFNDIANTPDVFLSLSPMNKIVDLDEEALTVTVEAGIRYGELASWLHNKGYALHNLASLPHISVAGGCATATHGSGVRNANLSSAVSGMELVTASGDVVRMMGRRLEEAVVHLGGMGVVTRLTLSIQPSYQVRQYVYEHLPLAALETHFEEIMSAGYSVSLFTEWRDGPIDKVWIKSRDERPAGERGKSRDKGPAPEFFGARAATGDLHPIRGVPAEHCTPQMGVPGPWHERLPHFKMAFTPSSGKELQSEYLIPFEHSYQAIMAVNNMRRRIAPLLLISEIRCVDADDIWMSPCYGQPCTAIHFTWKQDWAAVKELLPEIERVLAPYQARPHWGKLFTMGHQQLAALYPKMRAFQQLLKEYDPGGKFRNDYLDSVIFGKL